MMANFIILGGQTPPYGAGLCILYTVYTVESQAFFGKTKGLVRNLGGRSPAPKVCLSARYLHGILIDHEMSVWAIRVHDIGPEPARLIGQGRDFRCYRPEDHPVRRLLHPVRSLRSRVHDYLAVLLQMPAALAHVGYAGRCVSGPGLLVEHGRYPLCGSPVAAYRVRPFLAAQVRQAGELVGALLEGPGLAVLADCHYGGVVGYVRRRGAPGGPYEFLVRHALHRALCLLSGLGCH